MNISVIIPCFNSKSTIGRAINSILNQSMKPEEIIVVDGGSNDGTANIVSQYPVSFFQQDQNYGVAVDRTVGAKAAKGDVLVYIDADCIAPNNLLFLVMKNFMEYPQIAAVGGQEIPPNPSNLFSVYRSRYLRQTQGSKKIMDPPFLYGLVVAFKTSALKDVGYFNPFFKQCGDDVDVSRRLKKNGFKLFYDPEIKVWHLKDLASLSKLYRNAYMYSYYGKIAEINTAVTSVHFSKKLRRAFMLPQEKALIPVSLVLQFAGLVGSAKARLDYVQN